MPTFRLQFIQLPSLAQSGFPDKIQIKPIGNMLTSLAWQLQTGWYIRIVRLQLLHSVP